MFYRWDDWLSERGSTSQYETIMASQENQPGVLHWVYRCAFYQLSFTVWMEAAAELESLWSFYLIWQWARLLSLHEVCSVALLFRWQLTQKQQHKKRQKKKIAVKWLLVCRRSLFFPEGRLMLHSSCCSLYVHSCAPQQRGFYFVYGPVTFILTCLSMHL